MAVHSAIADMQKVEHSVVISIRDDLPISDTKLDELRNFTKLLIEKRGWVVDDDIQSFLDAGYNTNQMLDILVGVAQKTLSNFTNHIAKTHLDEPLKS